MFLVKNMKNDILINDIIKELDDLIFSFNIYYTFRDLDDNSEL